MHAVKGLFDGKNIKLTDLYIPTEPQEVIVTFLGDDTFDAQLEINSLAESGKSFEFLNEEDELYSEKDLKVRYS